jgi:uncharacterized protein
MKIDPRGIPPAGIILREEEDPSFLDLREPGLEFVSPVRCRVEAHLAGGFLLVKGDISVEGRFVCSRCLEKFKRLITVSDFRVRLRVETPDLLIDLTDKIREDIILALPYKPLCSEECRGLCPGCGMNLNQGSCDCRFESPGNPFSSLT